MNPALIVIGVTVPTAFGASVILFAKENTAGVLSTAAWCWALNRGHICPHRRSIPSVPSDGVGTTQQCRSLRRSHLRRRRPDIVPL